MIIYNNKTVKIENGEYIVKAREFDFYKDNKNAQIITAIGVFLFDIYILIQFLSNRWYTMGIIIFSIIALICLMVLKVKYSILIKDKKIIVERFFRKYEINYCDLIRVRKVAEKYYTRNYYHRVKFVYYLLIEYICDGKIKYIKDNYGLGEREIDEICYNFITNYQDNGQFENSTVYLDVERNIDINKIEDVVEKYDKNQFKWKVIVVTLGIIIFISMFVIAKITRIIL